MDAIKKMLNGMVARVGALSIKGASKGMIYLFLLILFICIILFVLAWAADWIHTGAGNLQAMTAFIQMMTSVSFIAAVGFFGKALIDNDDDGIPDSFEQPDKDKKPSPPERGCNHDSGNRQ